MHNWIELINVMSHRRRGNNTIYNMEGTYGHGGAADTIDLIILKRL